MSDFRDEVLQAEATIRDLATELAKAKGITQNVESIEKRLGQAADALRQAQIALEKSQTSLQETKSQVQASFSEATERFKEAIGEVSQFLAEETTRMKRLQRAVVACVVLTGLTLGSSAMIIYHLLWT